jgi:GTP cyclohydrolase IA
VNGADWYADQDVDLRTGVRAEHLCMSLRGVRAGGSRTTTSALLGLLREDARTRAEFLSLTRTAA